MPLLVATTMIAEQGRTYFSAAINLMLADVIDAQKPLSIFHIKNFTSGPISWLNALMPVEVYQRTKSGDSSKKNNKRIRDLTTVAGYLCMTHTGSFIENLLAKELSTGLYLNLVLFK